MSQSWKDGEKEGEEKRKYMPGRGHGSGSGHDAAGEGQEPPGMSAAPGRLEERGEGTERRMKTGRNKVTRNCEVKMQKFGFYSESNMRSFWRVLEGSLRASP